MNLPWSTTSTSWTAPLLALGLALAAGPGCVLIFNNAPAPRICNADRDCRSSEVCEEHQCTVATSNTCASDTDCHNGETCRNGACAVVELHCTTDSQCDANQHCQPVECLVAPCPPGNCVDNVACTELAIVCPDGFVAQQDPATCAQSCVFVDPCSKLNPNTCQQVPGCTVTQLPCNCGPACDCVNAPVCVSSCTGLPPDACALTPGCQNIPAPLTPGSDVRELVCVPVTTSCNVDSDCGGGLVCNSGACGALCVGLDPNTCSNDPRCAVVDVTPPCDCPTDSNCACPGAIEATCQPRGQPQECSTDDQCSANQHCQPIACFAAPCPPGLCQDNPTTCQQDSDCSAGDFCEIPPCLPDAPCSGRCTPRPTPPACQSDADCRDDQHCQVIECLIGPCPPSTCVDNPPPPPTTTTCLTDGNCAAGESCRTQSDVCLADPSIPEEACLGWCVGACGQVVTAAVDASGRCVVFPDTCIAPGFQPVGGSLCP